VLAQYDIADKAKLRELQGVLVRLDLIEGRYDSALAGRSQDREPRGKAGDKLLSGLPRARDRRSAACHRQHDIGCVQARGVAVDRRRSRRHAVRGDPERDQGAKASAEIISEALALGYVNNVLQPTVDKAGALSSELRRSSSRRNID
jgi:hypothetical protein